MTRACVERSMHEERHKKSKSVTTSADSARLGSTRLDSARLGSWKLLNIVRRVSRLSDAESRFNKARKREDK